MKRTIGCVVEPQSATGGSLIQDKCMATRKKFLERSARDHEFRVAWNQERSRFDIYRDSERTSAFSYQRSTAVGLAIREARQEVLETGKKIIVISMNDGRRIVEWDSF